MIGLVEEYPAVAHGKDWRNLEDDLQQLFEMTLLPVVLHV